MSFCSHSRVVLFSGIVLALASIPSLAPAQEQPGKGTLYGVTEESSLAYSCLAKERGTIECEFLQASVRRKLSAQEADAELQKARYQFDMHEVVALLKDCDAYRFMLDVLEGRSPPSAGTKAIDTMSAKEKSDFAKSTSLLVQLCASPTHASWLALVRANTVKKRRTCQVASSRFVRRFRQAGPGTWTVVPEASIGPCPTVRHDHFEIDRSAESQTQLWSYVARTAATEPKAGTAPVQCPVDARESRFESRRRDPEVSCDYIESGTN
jgi:hypothetical protein